MTEDNRNITTEVNRKFSISRIRDRPRKSVVVVDPRFEFDAPKFYDFSNEMVGNNNTDNISNIKQSLVITRRKTKIDKLDDDFIDPWFFIDHSKAPFQKRKSEVALKKNEAKIRHSTNNILGKGNENKNITSNTLLLSNQHTHNVNINSNTMSLDEMLKIHNEKVKKRKFDQMDKENHQTENLANNNSKNNRSNKFDHGKKIKTEHVVKRIGKDSKMIQGLNGRSGKPELVITNNQTNIPKSENSSVPSSNDSYNKLEKEANPKFRVNRFRNKTERINTNQTNVLGNNFKRSTTADSELNKTSNYKQRISQNKSNSNKRIKSAMRSNSTGITYCPRIHNSQWELLKGVKWYDLSPNSRHSANQEITEMIKNKTLI